MIFCFCLISCSFKSNTIKFTDTFGKEYKIRVPQKFGNNLHKSYYSDGSLEFEANYINGKPDGFVKYWLNNGILISTAQYQNGKLHGNWYRYHKNGNLAYEGKYFYGQLHGNEKYYHQNGNIKSSQEFKYGKDKTELYRFDINGKQIYQP